MAVFKKVLTEVYCDICGEQIAVYESTGKTTGVSIGWAKYFARQKGCTTGKKIVCKRCRISARIENCSLQIKLGRDAGRDGDGTCMGFGKAFDDEPVEECKRCIACTEFDWETEKYRLSIDGRKSKQNK